MKKRHKLRLVGITYNQIESGVYAVILEEVDGERRIPIVIGYPEAQAIECHLQQVKTPRPLTHDLIKTLIDTFNLRLVCIDIRKLPTGVFAADLVMENQMGDLHKIDARSSDAIAIAIRTGSPIYTSAEVLEESGFKPKKARNKDKPQIDEGAPEDIFAKALADIDGSKNGSLESLEEFITSLGDAGEEKIENDLLLFLADFPDKEIEDQISRYANEEKYELAARLKRVLEQRRNK